MHDTIPLYSLFSVEIPASASPTIKSESITLDTETTGLSPDHGAEILQLSIINQDGEVSSVLMKGSEYTVAIRFRFNRKVENPIFAFTIKDPKGTELCGTNTMLEGKTLERVEAGMTGVVRFRQKMRLQGGQYFLSLGCTSYAGDELKVHHRLYDICHIQVVSDYNTIGVYDVESDISYANLNYAR